jgi:hypothetical protein
MALIIRLLAANVKTASGNTALYTVPTTVSGAIVKNIRLVNTHTGSVTFNLYFTPSGGSQVRILDRDKSFAVGALVVVKPELTMAPSDKIDLSTSAGTSIDYVVSGFEKQ